jgi:plasmid stabilization system protein ParE
MTRKVSINEAAENEINEAADFYDLESPGLGSVFLDEIDFSIKRILQFPDSSPILKGRVRMMVLRKFPYSVAYSVLPLEIRLLAVAHQKRRPFYWRNRR